MRCMSACVRLAVLLSLCVSAARSLSAPRGFVRADASAEEAPLGSVACGDGLLCPLHSPRPHAPPVGWLPARLRLARVPAGGAAASAAAALEAAAAAQPPRLAAGAARAGMRLLAVCREAAGVGVALSLETLAARRLLMPAPAGGGSGEDAAYAAYAARALPLPAALPPAAAASPMTWLYDGLTSGGAPVSPASICSYALRAAAADALALRPAAAATVVEVAVYASVGEAAPAAAGASADAALPCEPGWFCPAPDAAPVPCPPGTFSMAWAAPSSSACQACPAGRFCPGATRLPIPCGHAGVACAAGAAAPVAVPTGSYSYCYDDPVELPVLPGEPPTVTELSLDSCPLQARSRARPCPAGTWCSAGQARLCAAGRWGTAAMTTPDCAGACAAGFACPAGSASAQQRACGNESVYCPGDAPAPLAVPRGWYSLGGVGAIASEPPSCASAASIDAGLLGGTAARAELPTSACAGWAPAGAAAPGLALEPPASGLAGWTPSIVTACGTPRSPLLGPAVPPDPAPLSVRARACSGGALGDAATRAAAAKCEPGFTCTDGLRFACPPGRIGALAGESRPACAAACPAGRVCGWATASVEAAVDCGSPAVYCPESSGAATPVDRGFHTDAAEPPTRKTRQMLCPAGFYCPMSSGAQPVACPPGTWQPTAGASAGDACLLAPPGFFTPQPAATRATDFPCGGGGLAAAGIDLGAGRGALDWPAAAAAGSGAAVFCPAGSAAPTAAAPGYFTVGGYSAVLDLPMNTTRVTQLPCAPGWVCEAGIARQCPAGSWSNASAARSCEPCPAGYFCPPGATSPTAFRCGDIFVAAVESPPWQDGRRKRRRWQLRSPPPPPLAALPASVWELADAALLSVLADGAAAAALAALPPASSASLPALAAAWGCAPLTLGDTQRVEISLAATPGIRAGLAIAVTATAEASQSPPLLGQAGELLRTHAAACAALGYAAPLWSGGGAAPPLLVDATLPWEAGLHAKLPARAVSVSAPPQASSRWLAAGGPRAVFCPPGSGEPMPVPLGSYSASRVAAAVADAPLSWPGNESSGAPAASWRGIAADDMPTLADFLRDSSIVSEPGFFAVAGTRLPCPPGVFGAEAGLATPACSGACPAGHACPGATAAPAPCLLTEFAPAGSAQCTPCASGRERSPTCAHARSCCGG